MAWELTRWLVLTRAIALLGVFVSAAMNGYLTGHIHFNKLGLSESMVSVEFILCVVLLYNTFALVLTRSKKVGAKRTKRLTVFVVGDVLFVGAILAVVAILSRTGVPSNCAGLTDRDQIFSERRPGPGFTTVGFSSEYRDAKGELDKLCNLERGVFFIATGLVYTFILSIVLGILVRYEYSHTKNSKVYHAMDALRARDSTYALADKLENSPIELTNLSHRAAPPVPPSEGVTSPRTSVREPVRSHLHPHHVTQPIPLSTPSRSSIPQQVDTRPDGGSTNTLMRYQSQLLLLEQYHEKGLAAANRGSVQGTGPVSSGSSATLSLPTYATTASHGASTPPSTLGTATPEPLMPGIVSDDSQDHLAAAAMVTDGSQGFGVNYQPGMATLPPYSPSSPTVATRTNAIGGPNAPNSPPRRSEKT